MPHEALFFSETPDHPAFTNVKYQIGDMIKVVQICRQHPTTFESETINLFNTCVGRRFKIKDIMAWERLDGGYLITHEIYVGHLNGESNRNSYLESIYLEENEIAPVKKRK